MINIAQKRQQPVHRNVPAEGVSFFTPAQIPPSGTAVDPQPNAKPIPKLFTPLKIRGVTLQNRIWLSPLCQYSAKDGFHQPWHSAWLGGVIIRGPGLVMVEASAVQARGRISPEDSGIWLDEHIPGLRAHTEFAHSQGQKMAIQLAHAGRKGSVYASFVQRGLVAGAEAGGWPDDVIAPSAIPFNDDFPEPREITLDEIVRLRDDFAAAARRAVKADFDVVEIHAAHGYMLYQFLSPVSNHRTDSYGGSFENRIRLLLEVVDSVRAVIPEDMPLFLRISATDWLEEVEGFGPDKSWTIEDTVRLAKLLPAHGVDVLDVSSGGNHPLQKVVPGPAYQALFAKAVKKATGDSLIVSTVGSITSGAQAEALLAGKSSADSEALDMVAVGRLFQKNPGLVWDWADELDTSIYVANQIGWGFGGRTTKMPTKAGLADYGAVPK